MQQLSSSVQLSAESYTGNRISIGPDQADRNPIRAMASILARGVLRLQQRQKDLDKSTEQSVHHRVLPTKTETP